MLVSTDLQVNGFSCGLYWNLCVWFLNLHAADSHKFTQVYTWACIANTLQIQTACYKLTREFFVHAICAVVNILSIQDSYNCLLSHTIE